MISFDRSDFSIRVYVFFQVNGFSQFIKLKNTPILGEMKDIMAIDMVTVKPETHIMVVVDSMLKYPGAACY